jgi:MFS transporter, SP family, arabinose:H+ symporter
MRSFFPKTVTAFAPGDVFLFFSFMMVLQLIWVKMMVVEMKGVPLEQPQRRLEVA